jgi:VIT1/CCC1 family predicted Fe2+/Mn2+ transporter
MDAHDRERELVNSHEEFHGETGATGARVNWLRAGVLGANDGIVSTAGVIVGVAGATVERAPVVTAGLAALVAGALSMGVGEFVSVSTQRDTEAALLAKERRELHEEPEAELAELAHFYEDRGLEPHLARQVAVQLTAHDALAAHAEVELRIDPESLTSPWHAALASMVSFCAGALLPLVAVLLAPHAWWVQVVVVAVLAALTLTGWLSARLGWTSAPRQIARNVGGGLLAMAVTYGIGALVGTHL